MKERGKRTQSDQPVIFPRSEKLPSVPDDIPQFPEDRIHEPEKFDWIVIPAIVFSFGFWWFVWMLVRFLMDKC